MPNSDDRLATIKLAVADRFIAALKEARAYGLISDIYCGVHEGLPYTEDELMDIDFRPDDEFDPCMHIIRLFGVELDEDDVHDPSSWS